MLIGRENELRRLEAFWEKDGFDVAVVYGRRRIGKSFLLKNFAEGKRSVFFQATADRNVNLRELATLVSQTSDISGYISYPDYSAAFSEIGKLSKDEKLLFIMDEISFLEESEKGVLTVLQKFVDNDYTETNLKIVLCSSYSSFMEERVIGGASPLYGRTSLRLKLQSLRPDESARFFDGWNLKDISDAHIIAGGVPYYLKRIAGYRTLADAVRSEFFTLGGALLSEPILLLYTWARNSALYFQILNTISSGVTNTNKIADKLQIDPAQASAMLGTLQTFGIVGKKLNAVIGGKKRGWEITDNFFAFWASFVFPAMASIEIESGEAALCKAIDELPLFVGRHIEEDIRKYIVRTCGKIISEYGAAEFPDPKEKTNEELDFIAMCDDGTYLFGEFKWRTRQIGVQTLDDLRRKSYLAVPKASNREFYLCSESGFSEELVKLSADDSTVHLITGKEIFGI